MTKGEYDNTPLSRTEAQLAIYWMEKQGIEPQGGWVALYKLTPSVVAEEYEVVLLDLLRAIRR